MIALVGLVVVVAAVLGGFAMAGGPFAVLLAWSEWVVIGGTALGTALISTPAPVLLLTIRKAFGIIKPSAFTRSLYVDALRLLYDLFQAARKDGLVAIESHIEAPAQSALFKRYPAVLKQHHAVDFLCDALRIVLVGSVPPHDLEMLMDSEIEVHHETAEKPVNVLQKVSDTLPGIGIVAAVLGIVVTMQSINGPIEEIGHHVGAALVGTFLGILLSYGFLNPIAASMEMSNAEENRFYQCLKSGVIAFAKGFPPIIAAEFARKAIDGGVRPSFTEMESSVKGKRAASGAS